MIKSASDFCWPTYAPNYHIGVMIGGQATLKTFSPSVDGDKEKLREYLEQLASTHHVYSITMDEGVSLGHMLLYIFMMRTSGKTNIDSEMIDRIVSCLK